MTRCFGTVSRDSLVVSLASLYRCLQSSSSHARASEDSGKAPQHAGVSARSSGASSADARSRSATCTRCEDRTLAQFSLRRRRLALQGTRTRRNRSNLCRPLVRTHLRTLLTVLPRLTFSPRRYQTEKAHARKRDAVPDKTVLYWKLYDGGIVEAKSAGSNLNYLLSSSRGAGAPEEPPRVMELFDVIRAIKFVEQDDRIVRSGPDSCASDGPS